MTTTHLLTSYLDGCARRKVQEINERAMTRVLERRGIRLDRSELCSVLAMGSADTHIWFEYQRERSLLLDGERDWMFCEEPKRYVWPWALGACMVIGALLYGAK